APKSNPNAPPFNPWYIPEWAYNSDPMGTGRPDNYPDFGVYPGEMPAPWEGIGTGWFYSALGGGFAKRPASYTPSERVPLTYDNTYDAKLSGDRAVPTVFNGNFNLAAEKQGSRGLSAYLGNNGLDQVPGWSLHNNGHDLTTQNL